METSTTAWAQKAMNLEKCKKPGGQREMTSLINDILEAVVLDQFAGQ